MKDRGLYLPEPAAFKTFQKGGDPKPMNKETNPKWVNKEVKDKRDEYCTFCNKSGHKRDGCFRLVGYPDWWPGKKTTDKPKTMVAHTGIEESPIPELTKEQYQMFVKHFSSSKVDDETIQSANMAEAQHRELDWCG
ncbi:hypothetical protein Lser_V15G32331 [Lactuca serriola]